MAGLKIGETIRGYRILEDFRVANGGNCEWTFAEKDGEEYFIKILFSPKYPVKQMGAPATIAKKKAACEAFESHQRRLLKAAREVAGSGGRLVVPTDFFRQDGFYYKVARKVNVAPLTVDEIAALTLEQQLSIMLASASALQALHNAKIVHGDLSPANILISHDSTRGYIANVIDFDSSYLSGDPPPVEGLMGNPPYYSPELLSYIQREVADGSTLTTQSDIFALGLVFWRYVFGSLPIVAEPHHYACEAVRSGDDLSWPRGALPDGLRDLVLSMLEKRASDRPTISQVQQKLKAVGRPSPAPPPLPPPPAPPEKPYGGDSRIKPPKPKPGAEKEAHKSFDGGSRVKSKVPRPAGGPDDGPSRVRSK